MNANRENPSLQQQIAERLAFRPALLASFRGHSGELARARAVFELQLAPELEAGRLNLPPAPRRDPARELAGLEEATEVFRRGLAHEHRARLADIARAEALALEDWTHVASGEAEGLPCRNARWRPGFRRPPSSRRRCEATHTIGGELVRCSLHKGHELVSGKESHVAPQVRARARALLRECIGTCLGRRVEGRKVLIARVPCLRLHRHKGACKPSRPKKWDRACPCALCTLHEAVTSREWHEGRETGQRARFDRVRGCGKRMRLATCGLCGTARKAIPEGCGVRRACPKCDVQGAVRRRARFGRARGRAFVAGHRYGLTRRVRRGGRFSEKMLTLTIPHALLGDCDPRGRVRREARDSLHARVLAVFYAWPVFLRLFNDYVRESLPASAPHIEYHRAFEWTPGKSDEHGHPHFHVYMWSPFVDGRGLGSKLHEWWAAALRAVGWPVAENVDGHAIVSVRVQELRSVNVAAVRELMKGGKRSALTLSRIDFRDPHAGAEFARAWGGPVGAGMDAFKYAEGWTLGDISECSEDVRGRLYMALEGRRLTQASSGFFVEDPRAACECCGASMFRVRFEATAEHLDDEREAIVQESTGPPAFPDPWWVGTFAGGGVLARGGR